VPTEVLQPGLKRLLDVRAAVGLRNSAHSLVKLMNPCAGPAVIVSSYTHPEYAVSMGGGVRADRRPPRCCCAAPKARWWPTRAACRRWTASIAAARAAAGRPQGHLTDCPICPGSGRRHHGRLHSATCCRARKPVPESMALQVEHILHLATT
jgi:hypothetical protein